MNLSAISTKHSCVASFMGFKAPAYVLVALLTPYPLQVTIKNSLA